MKEKQSGEKSKYYKGSDEICQFCGGRFIGGMGVDNRVIDGFHKNCRIKVEFQAKNG